MQPRAMRYTKSDKEASMEDFMQIFLAVCGGIITTAGAGTAIYHLWKAITKNDNERDRTLKRHDDELENTKKRMDDIEAGMAQLMKSNIAIMRHLIDGNHRDDLEKEMDNLQDYLVRRNTSVLKNKEG